MVPTGANWSNLVATRGTRKREIQGENSVPQGTMEIDGNERVYTSY